MLEKLLTWITYSIAKQIEVSMVNENHLSPAATVCVFMACCIPLIPTWYQISNQGHSSNRQMFTSPGAMTHCIVTSSIKIVRNSMGVTNVFNPGSVYVQCILKLFNIMLSIRTTTTTVYFYYCSQTTKRIYKNIIINKEYIQQSQTALA